MLQRASMKESQRIFPRSPFLNHGLISSFTKVPWLVHNFFLSLNTKLKTQEIMSLKESCHFYPGALCQSWRDLELEIWEIQFMLKKPQTSIQIMFRKKTWARTLCCKRWICSLLFTITSPTPPKKRGKGRGNKSFTCWNYCGNGKKTGNSIIYSVEKTHFLFYYIYPRFSCYLPASSA